MPLCDGIRASRKRIAIFISLTGVTLYSGIEAWNKINKAVEIIGPIEAMPTRPKESSVAFLPPLTAATPAPKARINGTVADPVVTPPASNIKGNNLRRESSKAIMPISMNVKQ